MHKHEIIAKVYRGDAPESIHHGAIAVVDAGGNLTHYVGDPEYFTHARSSAKPFQLIPLIRTGAADYFKFSDKQLAIMCGSHSGTEDHAAIVRANLAAAGFDESNLLCGTHPPIYYQTENRLPRAGEKFAPAQHNCSGKHSGFLALTKFLDGDPSLYLDPESKTQQLVLEAVSEMYQVPKADIKIGIDGCSAPVFGMPLKQTAAAFVRLANEISEKPDTKAALSRIRQAITAYPEMVSGKGRFDLALARTFSGNVVNKVGAEGIEGIGFARPQIGIAIKALDGSERALYPAVVETLRQLGLLNNVDTSRLKPFINPEIRNYRNIVTGKVVAEFELKSVR